MPELFTPLKINAVTLPNRIVVTAMVTRLSGEDGQVNQAVIDRYARFAKGEAGLVVVEATAVHAGKSGPLLRLNSSEYLEGHRRLLAAMRAAGPSKVALQIIHFLKIARSGWRQTVESLTAADIEAIIEAYGTAAARVREAGYDAVEIHMAHAYTLSSFLSARNRRRDGYGGRSLQTRLRLPMRVLERVREKVGPDFAIGVRFDGEECIKGGYGLNDAQWIALRLAQTGADYVSVSAGGKFEDAVHKSGQVPYPYTGYSGDRTMPPAAYPDGANLYLAAGIKQFINAHGLNTPVVATGKISTPALAQAVLRDGQADLVGFARALLADPDWPRKVRLGQADRIVRCIYGNVCKNLDENFHQVRCGSLWPRQYLHAPEAPDDDEPPTWTGASPAIQAELNEGGQIRLTWAPAQDPRGVYGYEVFRSMNDGPFIHLTSSLTTTHVDPGALSGNRYRYCVRAYDFAGNRSVPSPVAEILVGDELQLTGLA